MNLRKVGIKCLRKPPYRGARGRSEEKYNKEKRLLVPRVCALMAVCWLVVSPALAYTECTRPVKKIWNSLASNRSVWIVFSDGGGAIWKDAPQVTEEQLGRLFSQALTAHATGRHLIVRYPEDGLTCPPANNRDDVLGVWLSDQ